MSYKKTITEGTATDSNGNLHSVSIKIERTGNKPLLYINYTGKRNDQLCNDLVFTENITNLLEVIGYTGPRLDVAEFNMQGPHLIVLEPNSQFTEFVVNNFNFLIN